MLKDSSSRKCYHEELLKGGLKERVLEESSPREFLKRVLKESSPREFFKTVLEEGC